MKKMVLIVIVALELIGGLGFLVIYNHSMWRARNVLGAVKIATIDKDTVLDKPRDRYNYYYELQPNTVIKEKREWLDNETVYHINGDGLNDLNDYETAKSNEVFRIIALGDSFTFGENVSTKDNWTEVLEQLLNSEVQCANRKIEVLNLGMRGFDVPYLVERYRSIGSKYDPDMILWYESGSGFTRYLEYLLPIVGDCKNPTFDESSDLTQLTKEKIYKCWTEGEQLMRKQHAQSEINKLITDALVVFFANVQSERVYYVTSNGSLSDGSLELLQQWKNMFFKVNFDSTTPRLTKNDLLLDGHPSKEGHKKIAIHMMELLNTETPEVFACN